jgi:hypothetical protein
MVLCMLHTATIFAVSSNSSMVRGTVIVVLCVVTNTRRHHVQDLQPHVYTSDTHKCFPKMRKTVMLYRQSILNGLYRKDVSTKIKYGFLKLYCNI